MLTHVERYRLGCVANYVLTLACKAFYSVLGINNSGRKEILGLYLSENEGARFWLGVLNDLWSRGVEDILIASIDGLKGFPKLFQTFFTKQKFSFVWFTKFAIR